MSFMPLPETQIHSRRKIDLSPEPDLHPLYPTTSQISEQLGTNSGLNPAQKAELIAHCLTRACAFGDILVVQYLLTDPRAQVHVDLSLRDEDGVNLISLTICGFGGDSDRDVEREECVRLLVSQGADMAADKAGWTPLHYAAILAPPTLVSYLMTHGCSPFALTKRKLTPLDIVTAHSILPGKEDIALLLEEAMRSQGWTGGRMEEKRRLLEQRTKRKGKEKELREEVGKALGVSLTWWGTDTGLSDDDSDSEEDDDDEGVYTPRPDYSSMLVFSPPLLTDIFESLITNYQPTLKDTTPANALYMLARFAALTCDHTWLEDVIIGATDAIEETFFNRAEDLSCLVFWLYNTTIWLHLLQCDKSINEACEMLGSFEMIEEVINSVFVFIIRYAERRIDQLLDNTILSFTPMASEFEAIQFESEWSFLRPFSSGKRKAPPPSPILRDGKPSSPPQSPHPPLSPSHSQSTVSSRGPSSLRHTIARSRGSPSAPPLSSIFVDSPPTPSPYELTAFLTSLHLLLILSEVNPAIVTQLWSQVMYWTSCEIFNRIITRKKYLCRSRAVQISMNLTVIEEWMEEVGLPPGIQSHFAPVKDLLNWLQCLSSIAEFPDLVATIQTMKNINPLQMRRAVRDYRYEVNEGRMTEECIQYLTQLQKDWERHRVKLGVEAIRKELIVERDRDENSSVFNDAASTGGKAPSVAPSTETTTSNQNIDILFDKTVDITPWEPVRPSPALGELLDSRHMLPLLFPSDPRLLAARPRKAMIYENSNRISVQSVTSKTDRHSSPSSQSWVSMPWVSRNRKLRKVGISTLQWVDGMRSAARWGRLDAYDYEPHKETSAPAPHAQENPEGGLTLDVDTRVVPFTRKPSGRAKSRPSTDEVTPIDGSFNSHILHPPR